MSYIGINNAANNTVNTTVGRKNYLINGNFDIWQRSTSQSATINGYGCDDRWINAFVGSTRTCSQQLHTLGQTDIPSNPKYFSRTIITAVGGTNSQVVKYQKIENGCRLLSGKTVTLSFYAKADATKNLVVEFSQIFGSGGSPSARVDNIGTTTCNLTTTWQKFTVTVVIPSILGKSLGTANDDVLLTTFWFDAGSTLDSRTNALGHQTGTFDISQVQLEEGTTATSFDYRPIGMELFLCQRYYEESYTGTAQKQGTYTNFAGTPPKYTEFKVVKRITPTLTVYTSNTKATPGIIAQLLAGPSTVTTGYTLAADTNSFNLQGGAMFSTVGDYAFGYITADAEL